ncbi:hypothetical protein [Paenibacillus alvei]|uniref:Uncharacterized protein n=1 Tax=Paenibacillus alvei TaxID=44250 RepID=A0A383RC05_PAEAL|nr:hypothetical protein [Paenibacillus alvei]SYX84655.1 conserved protein of unknown function [Paenibacillus alvei]
MSKRIVTKKTAIILLGVPVMALVSRMVYLVQVKDVAKDQWHKAFVRMDKLLAVGHRKRGDVGGVLA